VAFLQLQRAQGSLHEANGGGIGSVVALWQVGTCTGEFELRSEPPVVKKFWRKVRKEGAPVSPMAEEEERWRELLLSKKNWGRGTGCYVL
jgi:hypothetical protein